MVCIEGICVGDLAFVALEDKDSLPNEPCVYLVLDKRGSVLYVGKSENLRQKWRSYHKFEALSRLEDIRISYLKVEPDLLTRIENALIKAFSPPLNLTDPHLRGIAALRERAGLTQKQVADLVGVDPSTIRNWEYGKGMDMFAKLAKLCEVLECSPAELFEVKEVR